MTNQQYAALFLSLPFLMLAFLNLTSFKGFRPARLAQIAACSLATDALWVGYYLAVRQRPPLLNPGLAGLVGLGLPVGLWLLWESALESGRREALARQALLLGFSFRPRASGDDGWRANDFFLCPLFERGDRQYQKNVMAGAAGGLPVVVFDHRYTVRYGVRLSLSHEQTVAAFRWDKETPPGLAGGASVERRGESVVVYKENELIAPGSLPAFLAETAAALTGERPPRSQRRP
jgi:hypothetical protein